MILFVLCLFVTLFVGGHSIEDPKAIQKEWAQLIQDIRNVTQNEGNELLQSDSSVSNYTSPEINNISLSLMSVSKGTARLDSLWADYQEKFSVSTDDSNAKHLLLQRVSESMEYLVEVGKDPINDLKFTSLFHRSPEELYAMTTGLVPYNGSRGAHHLRLTSQSSEQSMEQLLRSLGEPEENDQCNPTACDMRSCDLPPLDQGKCGGCWALTANAVVESQLCTSFNNSQPARLGIQQLIDCTYKFLRQVKATPLHGCSAGGHYFSAWGYMACNYAKHTPEAGIGLDKDYPFVGGDDGVCCSKPGECLNYLDGGYLPDDHLMVGNGKKFYATVPEGRDLDQFKAAVKTLIRTKGALAAAMAVPELPGNSKSAKEWMRYDGTYIMRPEKQCTKPSAHAVTISGYGRDASGTEYWIVKNSWGTKWGENGYLYVDMDTCAGGGVLIRDVSYPIIQRQGPATEGKNTGDSSATNGH